MPAMGVFRHLLAHPAVLVLSPFPLPLAAHTLSLLVVAAGCLSHPSVTLHHWVLVHLGLDLCPMLAHHKVTEV
jgi:hypothetical protein